MRILFLDIEGVMTRGLFDPARFFITGSEGRYSRIATDYIRRLVRDHGVKLVITSGQDQGGTHEYTMRLFRAGIEDTWLYAKDPYAIPAPDMSLDTVIQNWMHRNPDIDVKDTAVLNDEPHRIHNYPYERVIVPPENMGMTRKEYEALSILFPSLVRTAPESSPIPVPPRPTGP